MTQRNRKTLIANFADGRMPTQEAFGDLIDSVVNIVDDGFEKTPADGVKIAQLSNSDKLVSFFDKIPVKEPLWSIAFSMPARGDASGNQQNLNIFYGSNSASGMTFAKAAASDAGGDKPGNALIRLGINNNNPEQALDVEGVVASNGRIGRESGDEKREVQADGEWHPIITGLDGCQAFEVMAGVGKPKSGRYALLHAYALNVFNSTKGNITNHQAHYASKCDQIELRWAGTAHNYSLEMRTRCSYLNNAVRKNGKKEEIHIRYYITQLWFDPFMDGTTTGQLGTIKKSRTEINPDSPLETMATTAATSAEIRGGLPVFDKIKNLLKSFGR